MGGGEGKRNANYFVINLIMNLRSYRPKSEEEKENSIEESQSFQEK